VTIFSEDGKRKDDVGYIEHERNREGVEKSSLSNI